MINNSKITMECSVLKYILEFIKYFFHINNSKMVAIYYYEIQSQIIQILEI